MQSPEFPTRRSRLRRGGSFAGMHSGLCIALLPVLLLLGSVATHQSISGAAATAAASIQTRPMNFTPAQRVQVKKALLATVHPKWKDLSWAARAGRAMKLIERMMRAALSSSADPPIAGFVGNQTQIKGASSGFFYLQRQGDCSLTRYSGTANLTLPPTIQVTDTTAHIERDLHNAAGLGSVGGVFSGGCTESTIGIGSRRAVFLGKRSGLLFGAASGYDRTADSNALYYSTLDTTTQTVHDFTADLSEPDINGVTSGDLNGDGLDDVIGLNQAAASITVWLAKPDGTLGTPTSYSLSGSLTEAAVVADFNSDGKLDVVVATRDVNLHESLAVLTGKGDGTLNAAQTISVPTPSSFHHRHARGRQIARRRRDRPRGVERLGLPE